MIKLIDLMTSSGKYPDRALDPEATETVVENGAELVQKVNALLKDIGSDASQVSSGFRPSRVNSATPNAAKKSLHMEGMAVDLLDDKNQSLAKLIASKPELLKKHNLWLEHPDNTKGVNTNWAHLDMSKTRADRPVRIFKP
jgi:hypothetical protein